MKNKKRVPIFKRKVFKLNPFRFEYSHKRNISNIIGRERGSKLSGSCNEYFKRSSKLQRLLLSQSNCKLRSNILIDKRIGHNSYDMSEEEKFLDRYSFHLQRKYPDSNLNILSGYGNFLKLESTNSQSRVSESTLKNSENSMPHTDLLKLRTHSINTDSLFEEFPAHNSNDVTNLMNEVESQWHVMRYLLLPESRNFRNKYPDSYDIILGQLMFQERTNRYSPNFKIRMNIVEQEFSSEFVPYSVIVDSKNVDQDISCIRNPINFQKEFSEKLAHIQSTYEYNILVKQYISSLLSIDCNSLMENIFFICDQLIESMFTNSYFYSHKVQYIDQIYGSLCHVLSLHSKFTMKYFFMQIKSVRKFYRNSIDCMMDKNKNVLVLYFLLSLIDIGVGSNYPIVKFGITVGVEILSNCYCISISDAGFLLLLIDAIINIGLTMKRFVPEVFNFLTSFISLFTKSSETIYYPPFSNSSYYIDLSEFQVSQIKHSPDQMTDWNFLFNKVVYDNSKFVSLLLHITLGILSRYFNTSIEPFSHFGILLLPLFVNLQHLQKRFEFPFGLILFVDRLLLLINPKFEDRKVKLGLFKARTKSLRFLNLEKPYPSKNVNRVYKDKQIKKYTRYHKSVMNRIRKDNCLLSDCCLRQQLFNDITRKAKVDKLQNSINENN